MTDSNTSQNSDGTSSGKSENAIITGKTFPVDGDHDVDYWADIWGVTPRCIRDWVKKFEIPVWGPSKDNYFIAAEDFKAAFEKRTI